MSELKVVLVDDDGNDVYVLMTAGLSKGVLWSLLSQTERKMLQCGRVVE